MGTIQKAKLSLKDVASGNPKKIMANLPENQNQVVVGTIIGIANGIKEAKGADGVTPVRGLKGTFEGVPAEDDMDVVGSGVCFLPEAFMDPIIDRLDMPDAKPIQFAAEVMLIRAANPAGYSWALRPVEDQHAKANDPLASLRTALPKPTAQPAIADQSKAKKV